MKTVKTIVVATMLISVGAFAETQRIKLDKGWKFKLDTETEYREVTIPHDWSVDYAPYLDSPALSAGGFYPVGKGEYVLEGDVPADQIGGNISLYFEGVYRDATVYLNGEEVGKGTYYGYTWFRIDLTGKVKPGRNVLKVIADNSDQPNCRWYSGSGIFRNVWAERRGTEFIVPGSIMISYGKIDDKAAEVMITGTLTNTVAKTAKAVEKRFTVENPVLWSPETPHLYTADFYGEKVRYGIRTVSWNVQNGFMLNGKTIKLHGACVHHDHGPLGAASYDAAEVRKVRQLKAAGFNAVRTSHNPVSEAFINACDEEGLLVMDDMFDGWKTQKNPADYGSRFEAEWESDMTKIIERDRVHPSVVLWSIGNEVYDRKGEWAEQQAAKMVDLCHRLGPGIPVTEAICSWGPTEWMDQDPIARKLDIVGYNYQEGLTESDHERCPDRVMLYSETYPRSVIDNWRRITGNDFVIGEFIWTGIDYLGEATIGRWGYEGVEELGQHWEGLRFPWHGGYCGDVDITGWRKPISHLRETLWSENAPTYLAVREPDGWKGTLRVSDWSPYIAWDHWSFYGWEGKNVTAEVYTRKPKVRLSLNGEIVGEKDVSADSNWTAQFELPFKPGELKAEALDSSGNVVETCVLRSAGAMASIRYTSEVIGDLEWVTAEVVDKDGTLCPDASVYVTFEGDVIATVSADMMDNVPASCRSRRTWHGRAMAVRRK